MKSKLKTRVFANNFRGFQFLDLDISKTFFAVGDNSSGKSSILHLISMILTSGLEGVPQLDEELSVSRYDYFSKYFEDADVLLGYIHSDEERSFGKIITIKKNKESPPTVERCTYFTQHVAATIKYRGGKLLKRIDKFQNGFVLGDLLNAHNATRGFAGVKSSKSSSNPPPNHIMALVEAFDRDFLEESELLYALLPTTSIRVRHLAPVRGLPEKFYDFTRTISAEGRHFAAMWQDMKSDAETDFIKSINQFGEESGLFRTIDVRRVSKKIPDSPLMVTVTKNEKEFFLNQVGVGVSQVVPVLVECMFAKYRERQGILLLQQPELHLHPVAQAAMGSFLYKVSASNTKFIVETHSSYLVDRYRSHIRDDNDQGGGNAEILFCQNDHLGNHCTHIKIGSDGKLVDPPSAYFDFFLSELSRTMI